jgi:hypothetical protein
MLGVKVSRRVESGSFVDMGHSLIIYVTWSFILSSRNLAADGDVSGWWVKVIKIKRSTNTSKLKQFGFQKEDILLHNPILYIGRESLPSWRSRI